MPNALGDVVENLERVRRAVVETDADPRIGWAWLEPSYRSTSRRAFHGPTGPLTVDDDGMPALEAVMIELWGLPQVRAAWVEEDLWTVVLSMIGHAAKDKRISVKSAVEKLVKPRPVRQAAALANVAWSDSVKTVGGVTFASVRSEADAAVLADELDLDHVGATSLIAYSRQLLDGLGNFVLASTTSSRQESLAHADFLRSLEDLIGLTLMLSDQLDDHQLNHRRGSANRPGLRGLALDRGGLGARLSGAGGAELGAQILSITGWGGNSAFHWYSADPTPLDALLTEPTIREVDDVIRAEDPIAQRLRVAARWYARSLWADADDDSALSVSVALDSLLTGKDSVPGAVSKGRFALLERDVVRRAARFARYEKVYQVRSAIAHGGEAESRLRAIGGTSSLLDDARWVARQLLELRRISRPTSDSEFRDLWERVQFGTIEWTHPPA
ncbi:hypothetical protein BH09ACT4_BH09ACT4_12560 [soil metagenome]